MGKTSAPAFPPRILSSSTRRLPARHFPTRIPLGGASRTWAERSGSPAWSRRRSLAPSAKIPIHASTSRSQGSEGRRFTDRHHARTAHARQSGRLRATGASNDPEHRAGSRCIRHPNDGHADLQGAVSPASRRVPFRAGGLHGAAHLNRRHLRSGQLRRGPADQGNRRPHGVGRRARAGARNGVEARAGVNRRRLRNRSGPGAGAEPSGSEPAVWREPDRYPDVHPSASAPLAHRADGMSGACETRCVARSDPRFEMGVTAYNPLSAIYCPGTTMPGTRFSRRTFVKAGGTLAGGSLLYQTVGCKQPSMSQPREAASQAGGPADYTLTIAVKPVELAPDRIVSTTTYNGQFPGPLLRFQEGKQVTIDIHNQTDTPEQLHWHGQFLSTDVDGAAEEGTPFIPPHGSRRIAFVPKPSGYRFYHTHVRAGANLSAGHYTGLVGPVYIEPKNNPGNYDREVFLTLKEFEP